MAITLGVHASAGSADGNTAVTPARALTTGSAVIAVVSWGSPTAADAALSDNAGNTWVKVGTSLGPTTGGTGGYNCRGVVYKCENCTGHAAFVLTATRSGEYPSVAYQEYKGSGVTVEAFAQAADAATPFSSGNVGTPAANGAGLCGAWVHNANASSTPSAASPMTVVEAVTNISLYYPVALAAGLQTTAAPFSADFTSADGMGTTVVFGAFLKESGGGGPTIAEGVGSAAGTSTASANSKGIESVVGSAAGVCAATASGAVVRACAATSSPSGGTPALGVHNLTWGYHGSAVNPTSTPGLATTPGSSLLVLVANFNENDAAPTDNKGNTFTRVGVRQNYTLWSGNGVSAWVCHGIAGGSGHVVSVTQNGQPTGEVTMFVAEVLNGGVIQDFKQTEVLEPTDLVSGTVTATQNALLLGYWWGDDGSGPHTSVPRDGFTVLDSLLDLGSLIQGVMAAKSVGPGSYSVGWDETPTQGALLPLYVMQSAGFAPAVVGVTQTVLAATSSTAGLSTAAAVGASAAAAVGSAAGVSSVVGVGDDAASESTIVEAVGVALGTSSATAATLVLVTATGSTLGAGVATSTTGAIASFVASAAGVAAVLGASPSGTAPVRSSWGQRPRSQSRQPTPTGIRNGTPTNRRPN